MCDVEHRELTEQRTHGAAMLNVFHCNSPRYNIHSLFRSLHRSHNDYAKELFLPAGNVSGFPREITETALPTSLLTRPNKHIGEAQVRIDGRLIPSSG
jgi:hypothetical protein